MLGVGATKPAVVGVENRLVGGARWLRALLLRVEGLLELWDRGVEDVVAEA